MTQDQATATRARTHRLAALSALVGVPFLLAGLFPPWIIRIDYLAHAGCPSSPQCPPPFIDASSYWDKVNAYPFTLTWPIMLLLGLGPFLALILVQALIARGSWRGRPSRTLLRLGVLAGSLELLVFLFSSYFSYCFLFCNLEQGLPIPGELYSTTGLWGSLGVRYVALGFWLLLSGLLLTLATDLTLLVGARRSLRQPA
jgi:hypothetical protein